MDPGLICLFFTSSGSLEKMYSSPIYKHGLTLIPSWIGNHMPSKVWDEITYPFSNLESLNFGNRIDK